ncbi:DinB family protein [Parapedobacter defluvii]|uniref:DinB family protein n=1 Tax=Parapedobacter defluvii TaxID=2045106 RepID=UPI00334270F1
MAEERQLEVWMRGPISGVPALLQPVAHALLQVKEEVAVYMEDFDNRYLWQRPGGRAAVGFHLQHMDGVIERMFTYANNQALSEAQFARLRAEGMEMPEISGAGLVIALQERVDWAIGQLKQTDENQLTHPRYLGRKRIPTTLIGLLFHAAEHTQRHLGQLFVTLKLVPLLT